ncbi:hypothetical protein ACFYUV_09590 [Nonomuraea sp. NPDC003560]|uniref:hypothetical protein n=1 Tax=Nonomuraea sp. NPDC003560 TaxID=3364341 RepID=UPI0036B11B15
MANVGRDALIAGWSYRLLAPAKADRAQAAVWAVAGSIGYQGNLRILAMSRAGVKQEKGAGARPGAARGLSLITLEGSQPYVPSDGLRSIAAFDFARSITLT